MADGLLNDLLDPHDDGDGISDDIDADDNANNRPDEDEDAAEVDGDDDDDEESCKIGAGELGQLERAGVHPEQAEVGVGRGPAEGGLHTPIGAFTLTQISGPITPARLALLVGVVLERVRLTRRAGPGTPTDERR
ncbi:MAG: hypothetical protein ACYSUQ_13630 [Planctomycetota bacterium]|jgi:hypothetical protein